MVLLPVEKGGNNRLRMWSYLAEFPKKKITMGTTQLCGLKEDTCQLQHHGLKQGTMPRWICKVYMYLALVLVGIGIKSKSLYI